MTSGMIRDLKDQDLPIFSGWLDISDILSTDSSCTLENSSAEKNVK